MRTAASSRKRAKLGHAFRSRSTVRPAWVAMASPPYTSSPSAAAARRTVRPSWTAIERVPAQRLILVVEGPEPRRRAVGARVAADPVELHEVALHVRL